jgi:hypothetical protein
VRPALPVNRPRPLRLLLGCADHCAARAGTFATHVSPCPPYRGGYTDMRGARHLDALPDTTVTACMCLRAIESPQPLVKPPDTSHCQRLSARTGALRCLPATRGMPSRVSQLQPRVGRCWLRSRCHVMRSLVLDPPTRCKHPVPHTLYTRHAIPPLPEG